MVGLTGILACDPGWKGLAMTLFVPSLQYKSTRVFALNTTGNKAYKRPSNTIPLLVDRIVQDYWKTEPRLRFVNKIIIESQHKLNMQQLGWFIQSVLSTLLPHAKVEYISPLHCKRLFKVELGKSHYENKKRMLAYVKENADSLIAGDTVTTHDSADSIILLNTFLRDKNRRIDTRVFTVELYKTSLTCPVCSKPTGRIHQMNDGTEDHFVTCKHNCEFSWLGSSVPKIHTEIDTGERSIDGKWKVASPETEEPETKRKKIQ